METAEGEVGAGHAHGGAGSVENQTVLGVDVCRGAFFVAPGERQHAGFCGGVAQLVGNHGVVLPVDEAVGRGHVLEYAELGAHVVAHVVAVAVEVVGGDVENHGHVGLEAVHVVELETAEFHHIHRVRVAGHLPCQAFSHIAGQGGVDAGAPQDVVGEQGGGGLAVAAGYAHHLGVGVAAGEFYLADYRDALGHSLQHNRRIAGNAGAFYYLGGREDACCAVAAFLEGYVFLLEHFAVARSYGAAVAKENVEALVLGQDSRSGAALAGAEHHYSFVVVLHCHRILRVTKVTTASMMPIIQKRVTIFDSCMAAYGLCMRAFMVPSPGFW